MIDKDGLFVSHPIVAALAPKSLQCLSDDFQFSVRRLSLLVIHCSKDGFNVNPVSFAGPDFRHLPIRFIFLDQARTYLDPDHLTIVIVGDRKVIEGPIRALNLGPITVVPIDDLFR